MALSIRPLLILFINARFMIPTVKYDYRRYYRTRIGLSELTLTFLLCGYAVVGDDYAHSRNLSECRDSESDRIVAFRGYKRLHLF